ncbi:hypothetical protein SDC9_77838 [bioreactor metagenome]|uniref:Uncharacterized protein n=1 Tax=bioreactor metagenome TaxID=1076179 RepID=A0A644YXT4_9ZZZZ
MAGDRLAALRVERLDAVLLDLRLAVDAEFLLDGQLDGQAVAVPAGLALDVVALHGPEPREDVLEDARLDVMRAGHAVGGRRALEEGPALPAPGALLGAGEHVVRGPEVEDAVFGRGQVDLRRDRVVGPLEVPLLGSRVHLCGSGPGRLLSGVALLRTRARCDLLRHVRPRRSSPHRPRLGPGAGRDEGTRGTTLLDGSAPDPPASFTPQPVLVSRPPGRTTVLPAAPG